MSHRGEQQKMEGSYDLDSSLINNHNEGLYNLPSVIQLHVSRHARDITWGGWIRLQWLIEERDTGHEGQAEFFHLLQQAVKHSTNCTERPITEITFLSPVCLFDCYGIWIDRWTRDRQKRDKYHTFSAASSPSLVTRFVRWGGGGCRERYRYSSRHSMCFWSQLWRPLPPESSVWSHNIFLTSLLSAK